MTMPLISLYFKDYFNKSSFCLIDAVCGLEDPQKYLLSCKIVEKIVAHFSSKESSFNPTMADQLYERVLKHADLFLSKISLFPSHKMCIMVYSDRLSENIQNILHNECYTLFDEERNLAYLLTFEVMKKQSSEKSQIIFCITEENHKETISSEIFTLQDLAAQKKAKL